jgi:hypothetical protein
MIHGITAKTHFWSLNSTWEIDHPFGVETLVFCSTPNGMIGKFAGDGVGSRSQIRHCI